MLLQVSTASTTFSASFRDFARCEAMAQELSPGGEASARAWLEQWLQEDRAEKALPLDAVDR